MIRFLAQLLLALFVFRVIFATARFLLGSRPPARPLPPPGFEPPEAAPPARRGHALDRENAIDVPFTEIPGPQP
jgi:hypothetical protein